MKNLNFYNKFNILDKVKLFLLTFSTEDFELLFLEEKCQTKTPCEFFVYNKGIKHYYNYYLNIKNSKNFSLILLDKKFYYYPPGNEDFDYPTKHTL